MVVVVDVVALARLIVEKGKARTEFVGGVPTPKPDGVLAERIEAFARNLEERNEGSGQAQSAWWVTGQPSHLGRLLSCDTGEFATATKAAMDELVRVSKPGSQSGLLVLARPSHRLVCLKLVLSSQKLTVFQEEVDAEDAISEETVTNILPEPRGLKKGALIPHPAASADARVVDEQLAEPAGYWLEFLGLATRPKEPVVAKKVVFHARQVLEGHIGDRASGVVAKELERMASSGQPRTVPSFLADVARGAEVPVEEFVTAVVGKDDALGNIRAQVTPQAMEKVELLIALDAGITVKGPAKALEGRFEIRAAENGDGWVVEVKSRQRPVVRERVKSGPG